MVDTKIKLTKLIERLPLLSKQLLSLYYVDELNTKEISYVLGIDEDVVKSEISRLILNLKNDL